MPNYVLVEEQEEAGMCEILNGKMHSVVPNQLTVGGLRHNRPPIINGEMSLDVNINGWTRSPTPNGCVLDLPLYHTALSPDSFKSFDKNAHSCSVTGALWTPQGRAFDGVDDYIALPDNILANASQWTIFLWLKAGDIATDQASPFGGGLTLWNEIPSLRHKLGKYQVNALHSTEFIIHNQSTSGDVLLHEWESICFLYDGSDCLFYRNGALTDTLTALDGKSLDATTVNSRLGGGQTPSSKAYSGSIGEVLIYNRVLSGNEISKLYLSTKWRYR